MIAALRAELSHRREEFGLGPVSLDGVILAGVDREPSSKVTFLLFDGADTPTIAAKVARDPIADPSLRREFDALTELWRTGAPAVTEFAPRPLLLEEIAGRLTLITTALRGEPMSRAYYTPGHTARPQAVEADLEAAASWLAAFQQETKRCDVRMDGDGIDSLVVPVVERYRKHVGWSAVERELFDDVVLRARGLDGSTVPMSGVHGDFWMGNLLVEDSEIAGVVDWELARCTDLPFGDVYKLPTSYGFYLDRSVSPGDPVPGHPGRAEWATRWARYGSWPNMAGFAYTYFGRGWFSALVREHVRTAFARLGVPMEANAVFFPLFLAEQAIANAHVASFRQGYQSLLAAFSQERSSTWLWTDGAST